jgi:hypothetical protein
MPIFTAVNKPIAAAYTRGMQEAITTGDRRSNGDLLEIDETDTRLRGC